MHECTTIRQARQFIVVRVESSTFFGINTSLKLNQHRRDCLQRIHFRGYPVVEIEVKKTENSPRGVTDQQRHRGARRRRWLIGQLRTVHVVVGGVVARGQIRCAKITGCHEDWVDVKGDLAERVGVGFVITNGPLGFENAEPSRQVVTSNESHVSSEKLRKRLTNPVENFLPIISGC